MKIAHEFDRMMRHEFPELVSNLIYRDEDGVYNVFDRYKIIPESVGYRVFCSATDVGAFINTKNALSWCIADKYKSYNTAREILKLDNKLASLIADITTRAVIADRSKNHGFREVIETKLESKIIRKKAVETELNNCVSWAKRIQAREFSVDKNKKKAK